MFTPLRKILVALTAAILAVVIVFFNFRSGPVIQNSDLGPLVGSGGSIAFDAEMHATGVGTASGSITTAGSNQGLFIAVCNATDTTGVNTPTVDGNNATLANSRANISSSAAIYYYPGLTAGSHTVSETKAAKNMFIQVNSYNGTSQTGIPDAHNESSGTNPKTTSVTVVSANSWLLFWGTTDVDASSFTSGALQRSQTCGIFGDSNGPVAAGSQSIVTDDGIHTTEYALMISFASAPATTNNFRRRKIYEESMIDIGNLLAQAKPENWVSFNVAT